MKGKKRKDKGKLFSEHHGSGERQQQQQQQAETSSGDEKKNQRRAPKSSDEHKAKTTGKTTAKTENDTTGGETIHGAAAVLTAVDPRKKYLFGENKKESVYCVFTYGRVDGLPPR